LDSFGHTLAFAYDSSNRIVALTQPDAAVVTFTYDTLNNLSTASYPDGKIRQYVYEDSRFPQALTGIIDENGVRFATYAYDASGRAISSAHAGGVEQYQLNFGTNSTTVTDPLNTARTYNFQTILGVVKNTGISQPAGSGCAAAASVLSYDANGNIVSRTDWNGNKTCFSHDLARNLESKRVEGLPAAAPCSSALAAPPAATSANPVRTVTTQWHDYWRLPVKMSEPLKVTTWIYNGDSVDGQTLTCAPLDATIPSINGGTQPIGVLCRKIEQATTDANGSQGFGAAVTGSARIANWTYNGYGQMLSADGPRTDVADITTTTYYDAADPDLGKRGNIASITDAQGHVTKITAYDGNGRPLSLVDANGLATQLSYDARGRLLTKNVGTETTHYQYDAVGQMTRLTLPDGASLSATYDGAHRLTMVADGLGNQIQYTLDAMGNRTQEDIKDPSKQLSRTRRRAFDALNRLYQDIGAANQTTQYAYDANGNLTRATDPLNRVTASSYDALNRLIKITNPANGQIKLAYNGQDKLAQVTDPRNLATAYTVDGLGNLNTQTSPDTGTTQYTHDAAGNIATRIDAKGQTTGYQYDALNRPILISYQDGNQERYTYDQGPNGLGRLSLIEQLTADQVTAGIAYGYDPQGRVTMKTDSVNGIIAITRYGYANGNLASITYPSGKRIDYSRDSQGRINNVQLTDNGQIKTIASQIQYHPFGGIKSYLTGSGQTITRSQDQDGRTTRYTLGSSTWQIGYDAASRITYQTDGANAANTATYGYDALDRLTQAILPTTTVGYAYDPNGNRTGQTIGGTSTLAQISAASNRLSALNTVPPKNYTYDANGSQTGDGQNSFGYDARGRLTQAQTAAGTTAYAINALGQRSRKTTGTEDTFYIYDLDGHVIAETDASGTVRREYLYLTDLPLAVVQ
jgi:YD repeat-containing protein